MNENLVKEVVAEVVVGGGRLGVGWSRRKGQSALSPDIGWQISNDVR